MTDRQESDATGAVAIPTGRYWGAQTERARAVFDIPGPTIPVEVIRAFGRQKVAAAQANMAADVLTPDLGRLIVTAAQSLADGAFDRDFPLPIWQTGSGTQTNMCANEVIANRANELAGQPLGTRAPVHPNDHVNRSQSSNDSFPTVVQIAVVQLFEVLLLPALDGLHETLDAQAGAFVDVLRVGRTHLNDAVPVTLGQNFASYARQIDRARARIAACLPDLACLPQGGTAAGSGLNAPRGFDVLFCAALSENTGRTFVPNPVKAEGMAAQDSLVAASGALEGLAIALIHILNDIRLLSSGPRCGLAELCLPDDGLSSSIMPGKRNATLAEALLQICHYIIGQHATVGWSGASGLFELNVARPVVAHAVLDPARAMAHGITRFREGCLSGIVPDRARMAGYAERSLMAATALTPELGYDRVAAIIRLADAEDLSLREACAGSGALSTQDFDRLIDLARMARGEDPTPQRQPKGREKERPV